MRHTKKILASTAAMAAAVALLVTTGGNDATPVASSGTTTTQADIAPTSDRHDPTAPTTTVAAEAPTTTIAAAPTTTTAGPADRPHEVLGGGDSGEPPESPTDELGQVDPDGFVPEGLDITAFPAHGVPAVPPEYESNFEGPGAFSPGPGCAYQCIVSGVAYPRGFGAELVVKTKVPADLWMSVIADTNDDGDWDFSEYESSPGKTTNHAWALDHLEPGQTYYAMVAATDEHDDTSYAWGEFTTLSTRTVEIAVGPLEIDGGPTNVVGTSVYARADSATHQEIALDRWSDLGVVDREVDLDVMVARYWDAQFCEPFWESMWDVPQGDSDDSCLSWNTASASVDLDRIPDARRWTSHGFTVEADTPTGAGGALPAGYGQPRHFHADAEVRVHVSYS